MLAEKVIEWRNGWVAEGRQETETTWLLRLLEQKFGSVAEDLRMRVETATNEQRTVWIDRLLTANRIEDIFEN